MLTDLYMVFVGVMFGLANVIPGVSGGTIAVVFGIYERLIALIADFRKMWKKELRFLITFAIGMGIGILAFGKLMDWLLENHPVLANSFFIGVIVGSIPLIAKEALFTGNKLRLSLAGLLPGLVTLGLMLVMALMGEQDKSAAEITGNYLVNFVKMIFFGVIASSCMIIPGISGSFVMVLLGAYGMIIGAVSGLTSNFLPSAMILIPLGIGCLIGLFGCAKLIRWLLAKYSVPTYSAILGFVIGSIFTIFPGFASFFTVGSLIAFVVGIACIVACNHFSAE